MSTYKLTYFNGRLRGELSRWVFAVANQKYDDVRIEKSQWQEFKPKALLGQLPMLEVDGIRLSQSNTIARFLAKRFNLVGKTDVEEALINMVVDCASDFLETFMKTIVGPDAAAKEAAKKTWDGEKKDQLLSKYEALLASNNGGNGYFVGKSLTLADLAMANALGFVGDLDGKKYSKLKAFKSRVESNPAIAKWIAKRPVTVM